jgi:hypothetical protein
MQKRPTSYCDESGVFLLAVSFKPKGRGNINLEILTRPHTLRDLFQPRIAYGQPQSQRPGIQAGRH